MSKFSNVLRLITAVSNFSDSSLGMTKEELEKYKSGFIRVSELASKSTKLDKEVKSLKEQLESKDSKISDLQTKIKTHTSLTESVNANTEAAMQISEETALIITFSVSNMDMMDW